MLFAAYVRFLTPDLFNEQESFRYMMLAVVGGIGSPLGGFAASLILTMIPEGLRALVAAQQHNVRLLIRDLSASGQSTRIDATPITQRAVA